MTSRKNTKRALILSALSLLLCVSMLVGSTMAWFTDNATTNVNKIEAGTLDIGLVANDGSSLEDKTLSFVDESGVALKDILWEPGAGYLLQDAKVVNNGNLWAKCHVVLNYTDDDANDGIDLGSVIDVYVNDNFAGTLNELTNTAFGNEFNLAPKGQSGDSATYGKLKLVMQTGAGNEYQGKSLSTVAVTVQATQAAVEKDSFGDQYDAQAEYADFVVNVTDHVSSKADLETALNNAEIGDVISVKSGVYDLTKSEPISTNGTLLVEPGENVILVMDTEKISSKVDKTINSPTVINNGNLTIEGGTISNKNATAGNTNVAAIHNVSGTLTLTGTTIENVSPTSGGAYAVVVEGGKVVLNNCTVKGGRGGIAVSKSGSVEMDGGSVTAGKYYPLYIQGTGNSAFNGVTFSQTGGKSITYNLFAEGAGAATFTTCKFVATKSVDLDVYNNTTGFTFNSCNYSNVIEPSA